MEFGIEKLKEMINGMDDDKIQIINIDQKVVIVDGPDKNGYKTKEDTGERYLTIHYKIKK